MRLPSSSFLPSTPFPTLSGCKNLAGASQPYVHVTDTHTHTPCVPQSVALSCDSQVQMPKKGYKRDAWFIRKAANRLRRLRSRSNTQRDADLDALAEPSLHTHMRRGAMVCFYMIAVCAQPRILGRYLWRTTRWGLGCGNQRC